MRAFTRAMLRCCAIVVAGAGVVAGCGLEDHGHGVATAELDSLLMEARNAYDSGGSEGFERADALYREMASISERVGRLPALSNAFNGLGMTFRARGMPDSALVYLHRARAAAVTAEHGHNLGVSLLNIGRVWEEEQRPDSALQYYRWARDVLAEVREREEMAGIADQRIAELRQ